MFSFIALLILAIIVGELIRYFLLHGLFLGFSVTQAKLRFSVLIAIITSATLLLGGVAVSFLPIPWQVVLGLQITVWLVSIYVFHRASNYWYHTPFKKNVIIYGLHSLISFLVLLGIVVVLRLFMYSTVELTSTIMAPSFKSGDRLLMSAMPTTYMRGDVVAFKLSPTEPTRLGRIIGLPGELIAIKDGMVSINGVPIAASSLSTIASLNTAAPGSASIAVNNNEYFILPDNRDLSPEQQSAYYRAIARRLIVGKMIGALEN